MKRQQRVGQYAWLVLVAFIGSLGWLYLDTVKATTVSKQVATIQTLPVDGSKDRVLSLTLSDGGNVQYIIKPGTLEKPAGAAKEGMSKEAVQNWRATNLGTALSIGDAELPLGIALKIPN